MPDTCRIRVKGCLENHWSEWFDGMTIVRQNDCSTMLCGPVTDDAALYGLIKKIRDSRLSIISLYRAADDVDLDEYSR